MYVICKYYTILYKGLEYSWILVSIGDPGTNPQWIPRDNCTFKTFCTYYRIMIIL